MASCEDLDALLNDLETFSQDNDLTELTDLVRQAFDALSIDTQSQLMEQIIIANVNMPIGDKCH